jgi:hypothetical protein
MNAACAILSGSRKTDVRAARGAVDGDNMKPPDGIEQHRLRELRGDDGPDSLKG